MSDARDWVAEARASAEDWTIDSGHIRNDVARALDVIEAADVLAKASEAYYSGMDACHGWGMSEGEGEPPACRCDQNAVDFKEALSAYQKARQG